MKLLKSDKGDGGTLEVKLFSKGKTYYVMDYMNGELIGKRGFYKPSNAMRYYKFILNEF